VFVNDYPVATLVSEKDTLCRGESLELTASGGDVYLWNTGETTPSIFVSPTETAYYIVTVSNVMNGTACPDTASLKQEVVRCNTYYTPNAFTPNGDGLNDVFSVVGQFKNVSDFEMMIFDRWGKLIFRTEDYNEPWDGTSMDSHELLPSGTYIYKIRISEGTAEPFELKGSIILMR
jgi:gliding motility-associated-like protein